MTEISQEELAKLESLRLGLKEFLRADVLRNLADLLDVIGKEMSVVERYNYFSKYSENKENCRYAQIAKKIFEDDQSESVVELIRWLYRNWTNPGEVK